MSRPDWKRTVPLPPTVRLAWHEADPFPRDIPLDAFYRSLGIPASHGSPPYMVANMVMTQNGEATVEGKATTIGTAVDGVALARVRSAVDAVVSGVGTLIHDDVTAGLPEAEVQRRIAQGRAPRLLAVVVASSLRWDAGVFARRFFGDSRFDKLVVVGGGAGPAETRAVERHGVEVLRVPSGPTGRPQIDAVMRALAARGVRSAVCEGGPRFLPSLFAARVLREYFLTTSPMLTGEEQAPKPVRGAVSADGSPVFLSRMSRHEHEFQDPGTGAGLMESFERFRVIYPEDSAARTSVR